MELAHEMSALCQKQTSADLFDYLVGQHEEVVWHFDPERPRGGEIDDEIEFSRLLDWEIAGLGPRAKSCPHTQRRAGIKLGVLVHRT